MSKKQDEIFMRRCIELAKTGEANTFPNPMVGSVIVCDGRIIGEGYHRKCGEPHAEVNAINSVKDKSLLTKSTIYVSLEPCAHQGRTPACSLLIIQKQIPRIVVGCSDSFDKVAGKGIEMLKNAGRDVIVGVLKNEARELNKEFFTYHEKKRPYIILKWAETLDGYIDFIRTPDTPIQPNWITGEQARLLVHKWRSETSAIMVGTNTAEKDNPKLNVRDWSGNSPVRVVIDRTLRLPGSLNLFDGSQKTLIFTEKEKPNFNNCEFIKLNFDDDMFNTIFKELYSREILSVFVEGGAQIISSLIKYNFWDEARVFVGDKLFKDGVAAPKIKSVNPGIKIIGNDKLLIFRNS